MWRTIITFLLIITGSTLQGATCTTTSTTTWDCGTPGSNDDLIVNHNITISGDFTVNNGSITVNTGFVLTIDGDLTFNNNSTVLVDSGACISVTGNFLNKNNSGDVVIFGTLVVAGDFTNGEGSGNGAVINVGSSGSITVGGNCDNPGTVEDNNGSYTGCDNVVLPVELVDFRGTAIETGNLLQWETASERNNHFFEIQRSLTALGWESIGIAEGNGDSDSYLSYRFLDSNPLPGRNFYRLKQVDYDGEFEYSYIISVETGQLPQLQVQAIYPNPSTGKFTISYITNNFEPIQYTIVDGAGRFVQNGEFINQFGSNQVGLDISTLSSGLYYCRLRNQSLTVLEKIVKIP